MPSLSRETANIARAMRRRVEREFGEFLDFGEPDLITQLQGYAERSRDGALKQLSDRLADLLEAPTTASGATG